jgi:hypothetical protein
MMPPAFGRAALAVACAAFAAPWAVLALDWALLIAVLLAVASSKSLAPLGFTLVGTPVHSLRGVPSST